MINFEEVAKSMFTIAATSSRLEKERLLRKYGLEVPGFKEVLQFIYNPYNVTGIGKKKLSSGYVSEREALSVEELMEYLLKHKTGTDADITIAVDFIYNFYSDVVRWAATGLVTNDLQIGVSVTTLNNVFGVGFIPIIGIMRGTLAPENFDGFYIATEKIDGNRRLIMCKETGVEIYTRSGHRDYGLVEIEAQAKQLPVGWVFDTECIAIGNWSDSIECRQASASILNSGGTKVGVKAFVFDMLMQHEYDIGRSTLSAIARKTYLAATMGDEESIKLMHDWFDHKGLPTLAGAVTYVATKCKSMHPTVNLPNITALPILGIVRNKKEAIELAKPIWETGGEGVMLVDHKSAYEVSPNPRKTLLKIKATQEYVLKCVGVVEGDNKYQGMLGAIEVEYTPAGSPVTYIVKVGSGFTDLYRQVYWTSPKIIVGTMVEIESFGESRNAQGEYSLNCPIFKRIVGSVE